MRKKIALVMVLTMLVGLLSTVTIVGGAEPNQDGLWISATSTTSGPAITLSTPWVNADGTTIEWSWVRGANRYVVEISDNWTGRSIEVMTGVPPLDIWEVVESYIDWHENWQTNRWWDGWQWRTNTWDWNNQWWHGWNDTWTSQWGWNQNWYQDWHWGWYHNWGWDWSRNWNRNWVVTARVRAERVVNGVVLEQSEFSRGRRIDLTQSWNDRNAPVPLPEPEVEYEYDYTEHIEIEPPAPEPVVPRLRFAIGSTFYLSYGQLRVLDVAPFIDPATQRTMVPLRAIAEGLGADVRWDSSTQTVGISLNGELLTIIVRNPLPSGMGMAEIVSDRTFVPLRYVMEAMGAEVYWDGVARAIYIY